jgi:hypothetical protein
MMESWKDGIMGTEEEKINILALIPLDPIFQYSIVPIFQR